MAVVTDHAQIQSGQMTPGERRLPIGAEVLRDGSVHLRLWAPRRQQVEVVFENNAAPAFHLDAEPDGYFSGHSPQARAGMRYRFRLDGSEYLYPDPATRFQPAGPHGPSQIIDPYAFRWTDDHWPGIGPEGQV